jgi:hypothetical protein
MFRFQDNPCTPGIQYFHQPFHRLHGEALLNLQVSGE